MNRNIQGLRALAAYGVVGHHVVDSLKNYIAVGRFTASPQIGATGVQIFFVISGFIMVMTTMRRPITPAAFLQHRIIRVVPTYWILTSVATVLLMAGLHILGQGGVAPVQLLKSLAFVPDFTAEASMRLPVLFVGWTLNYEMMFYVLFALCLFVPVPTQRLWAISVALLTLWIAGQSGISDYLAYWGNDIILAFLVGILLCPLDRARALPPRLAIAALPVALAGLALPDLLPALGVAPHGLLVVTMAAGLLVFAVLSLERAGIRLPVGWITRQGDASYALYLVHPFVLQIINKLVLRLGLNASLIGLVGTVVAMMVACGVCGRLFHLWVEMPLYQRVRRPREVPILAVS
ncbi:acyltransferase [Acidisphaera sp. L21]|uniref:acyltransferase family protein n=1 Tax=Acidisphaera sp. L21 TaxID=1641851 RepID=UPI00131B1BEF|nr:acyltransferase [Acidisphaera sp. L21]